ncbi:pyrroloquinoline quinone precursor peptide PqqA [Streptomyces sp. NPDC048595]|uniref:pyrroloquinoline quinone precursor peptide PqqA n=1 Tax=Streptomyces sp. NPDC048595 TaxID=3365576 RepID=UPI00370FAEFB
MKFRSSKDVSQGVSDRDTATRRPAVPRHQPADVWRKPDYAVIETALEVTAYSLTDR